MSGTSVRSFPWATGLALALISVACGGSGGGSPPAQGLPFTSQMLSGKAFYHATTGANAERGVATFDANGTFTNRQESLSGPPSADSGTWSIDANGKLIVAGAGAGTLELTLLQDAATYLDVAVREGASTSTQRLLKLVAIDPQALLGRHAVEATLLGGTTAWGGVIDIASGGTATFSDGTFPEANASWTQQGDGRITFTTGTDSTDLRQVAGSAPPSLRIVGESYIGGSFAAIQDVTLSGASSSGFATAMLADRAFYWEDTQLQQRSVFRFAGDGTGHEWYEDFAFGPDEADELWSVTAAGSLQIDGPPGWDQGILLLGETSVDFDVLWNDGSGLSREHLLKTTPMDPNALPGTWSVTGKNLDGSTFPNGTATLLANGTGDLDTEPLTWSVSADGALVITLAGLDEVDTIYQLATSTPTVIQGVGTNHNLSGVFIETLAGTLSR